MWVISGATVRGVVRLIDDREIVVQPDPPGTHLYQNAAFHGGEVIVDSDRMFGDPGEEALEVSAMLRPPPGLFPLFLACRFLRLAVRELIASDCRLKVFRAVVKPDTLIVKADQARDQHIADGLPHPVDDAVWAGGLVGLDRAEDAENLMLPEFQHADWFEVLEPPEVIQISLRGRRKELAGQEVSFLLGPLDRHRNRPVENLRRRDSV
ncbi:hypothetical protein Asppvi_001759 [Aspergillus pseudoviridinutans]|uniref:Uncharacterized protein n=1 Tax=Aspergillus pseudoviridinutans TaxID=1517512 RepID=A0A9P3F0F8_9EURO|nr:uncharacterized protein Asppvi_001759 [Aspergillus pseudoviridinutans]GIJ92482.1 hypothetical protein Asppvi_001759 [Aspergillus pseudoviridinutans]